MLVGLHDGDKTKFPNLALMKISTWHKMQGDTVEWWKPLFQYDKVYSSKVFTFSPENEYLPENTIRGGTGYGLFDDLPPEIDGMKPDYSIYPDVDYAVGYLTRGCIRQCPWCIVPRKEGRIRAYSTWHDIKREDSKNIVFMDNNVLACFHGVAQLISMIGQDIRIDFNQGLDARLISPRIAKILGQLKWIRFVRLSCDSDDMLDVVLKKANLLEQYGIKPWRLFVYVLVQDIPSAEKRCIALRDAGLVPFAQPYRDYLNQIEPTKEQKDFARWVNHKAIFKTVPTFSAYSIQKERVS